MAWRMAPAQQSADISTIRYPRNLEETPANNHNPILQPRWLVHVKIHLLHTVEHCETFIRTGAITTPSGKTIVSSRQHGFDIADGNLPLIAGMTHRK